jgi:hypothetical protein
MRVFAEVEKLAKQIQAETNQDTRREIVPTAQSQQQ